MFVDTQTVETPAAEAREPYFLKKEGWDFEFRTEPFEAKVNGVKIKLSPQLWSLLDLLLENRNKCLTRRRIRDHFIDKGVVQRRQNTQPVASVDGVDVAVSKLRKALNKEHAPIVTGGGGYKWVDEA